MIFFIICALRTEVIKPRPLLHNCAHLTLKYNVFEWCGSCFLKCSKPLIFDQGSSYVKQQFPSATTYNNVSTSKRLEIRIPNPLHGELRELMVFLKRPQCTAVQCTDEEGFHSLIGPSPQHGGYEV